MRACLSASRPLTVGDLELFLTRRTKSLVVISIRAGSSQEKNGKALPHECRQQHLLERDIFGIIHEQRKRVTSLFFV